MAFIVPVLRKNYILYPNNSNVTVNTNKINIKKINLTSSKNIAMEIEFKKRHRSILPNFNSLKKNIQSNN